VKKGCLIALAAIGLLILAAAVVLGVAYTRFNREIGLTEAPPVSHETVATGNTVFRVVLKPESMAPLLDKLIPPNAIPAWLAKLGYAPEKIIPKVLPREVAVLGAPDFATNKLGLTFFLNEKIGGPALVGAINTGKYTEDGKPLLASFPKITWSPEGAQLPERGNFQLKGSLAIPDTVEPAILKSWKPSAPVEPLRIEGTHHLEAVLDNRNGDILAFCAALMAAQGKDWESEFKNPPAGPMIEANLPDILDIRAAADMLDFDTVTINLRVDATAEKGPGLEFMVKMVWPNIIIAAEQNGVTLKGEPVWDAQKGALLLDITVTGIKPTIERVFGEKLPGPSTAPSAKK